MRDDDPMSEPTGPEQTPPTGAGEPTDFSKDTPPVPGTYGAVPPPPQWGEQPTYGMPQAPTPPPGYGPPAGAGQQQYAPPPAGYQYAVPDDPGAQPAMVTGVLSLVLGFFCAVGFLASPFALVMGLKSMRRIDAAGGRLGGRGNAQAGFIMGIVGTVVLALAILAFIAVVAVLVIAWDGGTIVINDSGVNA